jgi:drug/metabolite transporter (DMT)-like permease
MTAGAGSRRAPYPARLGGACAGGRKKRTRSGIGYLLVLLGACCWSLGGLFVRSTEDIDAWQIIFYRSWVVLIAMGGFMALRYGSRLPNVFREAGLNAAIAGTALGLAGLTSSWRCSTRRWRKQSSWWGLRLSPRRCLAGGFSASA